MRSVDVIAEEFGEDHQYTPRITTIIDSQNEGNMARPPQHAKRPNEPTESPGECTEYQSSCASAIEIKKSK